MKQKNLGFTLVELIIVIAILAILSTGAIAGYSVYVKQANMAADKALVAEIENALVLAGYSGTFDADEGGYLILSTEGISGVTAGSHLDKALQDAFGADYANAIKLKYDGWNASFISMDAQSALKIKNSSFAADPSALLNNVSTMTGAIADELAKKGSGAAAAMQGSLNEDAVNSVLRQLGVNDISELDSTQLANFAILAVAAEASNPDYASNPSTLGTIVSGYAMVTGYASSKYATESEKQGYADFISQVTNIPSDRGGYASTSAYVTAKLQEYTTTLGSTPTGEEESNFEKYYNEYWDSDNSKDVDSVAFSEMMKAVTNGLDVISTKDLANSDLATDGILGDYYRRYTTIADILGTTGIDLNLANGEVAVLYSTKNGVVALDTLSQ